MSRSRSRCRPQPGRGLRHPDRRARPPICSPANLRQRPHRGQPGRRDPRPGDEVPQGCFVREGRAPEGASGLFDSARREVAAHAHSGMPATRSACVSFSTSSRRRYRRVYASIRLLGHSCIARSQIRRASPTRSDAAWHAARMNVRRRNDRYQPDGGCRASQGVMHDGQQENERKPSPSGRLAPPCG